MIITMIKNYIRERRERKMREKLVFSKMFSAHDMAGDLINYLTHIILYGKPPQ